MRREAKKTAEKPTESWYYWVTTHTNPVTTYLICEIIVSFLLNSFPLVFLSLAAYRTLLDGADMPLLPYRLRLCTSCYDRRLLTNAICYILHTMRPTSMSPTSPQASVILPPILLHPHFRRRSFLHPSYFCACLIPTTRLKFSEDRDCVLCYFANPEVLPHCVTSVCAQ